MTTVQISDELMAAARREAERRGVAVDAVVAEAVQRFIPVRPRQPATGQVSRAALTPDM